MSNSDLPPGETPADNDYVSRTGQKEANVPVMKDEEVGNVEQDQPRDQADSDAQLEKDEKDAIDKSNIINDRTRGSAHPKGALAEPGDEDRMPPPSDGTSQGRQ